MKKVKALAIFVSLLVILCFTLFSIVGASTAAESFFIPQGDTQNYSLNLQVGQEVTGNFKIVGERIHSWEYFYFKIVDPLGVVFENEECVYTAPTLYNFTFKAYTTGYHNFTFDNSGSNDRYVELTYSIDGESLPNASTPTPTNSPEPTPTVPEFPYLLVIPLLLSALAIALIMRKKQLSRKYYSIK